MQEMITDSNANVLGQRKAPRAKSAR
jgi:hypothetical protein